MVDIYERPPPQTMPVVALASRPQLPFYFLCTINTELLILKQNGIQNYFHLKVEIVKIRNPDPPKRPILPISLLSISQTILISGNGKFPKSNGKFPETLSPQYIKKTPENHRELWGTKIFRKFPALTSNNFKNHENVSQKTNF